LRCKCPLVTLIGPTRPRISHRKTTRFRFFDDIHGECLYVHVRNVLAETPNVLGHEHPAKQTGTEMLNSSSWTWGLCLIVLTTAIHSLGIVLMSILSLQIRDGLKRRRAAFWQGVAIFTGLFAAIGLSLAVLHGIEAALWAAAYLGLGRNRQRRRGNAFLHRFDDNARRCWACIAPELACHGRAGSGRRHADVWY